VSPKGVLLLAYGGPREPDEVAPFLAAVTGGRPLPPAFVQEFQERYRLIGGRSPLPALVDALVAALQTRLDAAGDYAAAWASQFGRPTYAEGIATLSACGVRQAVAAALVPQYSPASVGRYFTRLDQELAAAGSPFAVTPVHSWATHPLLVAAFAERVRASLAGLPPGEGEPQVIFTAHSLPLAALKDGDPFVAEIAASASAVAAAVGLAAWRIAYQSAGRGGGPWLGPSLEETVDDLARGGRRQVLVVPLHFLVDNVEILYDIDVALRARAERLGLSLARSRSLNTSPLLVEALADLALNPPA